MTDAERRRSSPSSARSRRPHHPRRRRQDRADLGAARQARGARTKRVVGVARFSEPGLRESLAAYGIECIAADLLDRAQIDALPKLDNVVFMAGRKFGASVARISPGR